MIKSWIHLWYIRSTCSCNSVFSAWLFLFLFLSIIELFNAPVCLLNQHEQNPNFINNISNNNNNNKNNFKKNKKKIKKIKQNFDAIKINWKTLSYCPLSGSFSSPSCIYNRQVIFSEAFYRILFSCLFLSVWVISKIIFLVSCWEYINIILLSWYRIFFGRWKNLLCKIFQNTDQRKKPCFTQCRFNVQ